MDFSMCATYEYSNETKFTDTGTNIISDINCFIPQNKEIEETFKIKDDIINELNNQDLKLKDIDEKLKNDINNFTNEFSKHLNNFSDQQTKVVELEKNLKDNYNIIDLDINKLTDFTDFLSTINNKYDKDIDTDNINKSILTAAKNIKENNNISLLKEEYEKEMSILNFYFHNLIKKINNGNLGNTCSLCLQRNVDSFMNPCGHTACSECINKLKKMENHNTNCFICRKKVNSFNSLYFV